MSRRITLQDIFVEQLPRKFLEQFYGDIERAYREAPEAATQAPGLREPQQRYLAPHYRRALIETAFRNRAEEHGLKVSTEETDSGAHEYELVSTNALELTESRTDGSGRLPSSCVYRCQRSDANDKIQQITLFPTVVKPTEPQKAYGIITHGPVFGASKRVAFIRIGFPRPDMTGWVEPPVDLAEIIERSAKLYAGREGIKPTMAAKPKLKDEVSNPDESDEKT